jgi:hypothetical protein
MKKFGIGLFIVFIIAAGIYAVFQSNIGRNYVRNALTRALQESGYEVTIHRVDGTLPHQIELKGVSVHGKGLDIQVAEIKLRPVLWRLLKREAAFKDVSAKEISISNGVPFDFEGKFRLNGKKAYLKGAISNWKLMVQFDRETSSALFTTSNHLIHAKGRAAFTPNLQFLSSSIQIGSDQLLSHLPFEAQGRFLANIHIHPEEGGYAGRASWQIPNLTIENTKIGSVKGKGEAFCKGRNLQGTLTAEPSAKGLFDLSFSPDWILTGTSEILIENLQSLHIPDSYGKLQVKATWTALDQTQGLHLDGAATDFYYGTLYAEKISAYSDLRNPFHNPSGLVDLQAEKLKWHHLELETASFETTSGGENWPYKLFAEGTLRHPFELHMEGAWKDRITVDVANLNGTFLGTPFSLQNPVRFVHTQNLFSLPEAQFTVGGATAYIHIDRKGNQTDARIQCDGIPLDFLSLNPLEVKVAGTLNLDAVIKERNNTLQGELKASVEQIEPFPATGSFEGTFNRDLLKLVGNMGVRGTPLLNLDLSIPIHFSVWPFEAEILFHKDSKGKIVFDGRIEEFLDFLDLGPHRLEGQCRCDLEFSNTLYRPLLEGKILFQNGSYENYYSGTLFTNIQADLLAEKNLIYLRSLTAQDPPGEGTLEASGQIQLLKSDLYPFRIDAQFKNLKFVEIDLVNATADGKVILEGNALSALAKGDVYIQKCALSIPDHIPRPLPHLDVTYRNPIHPVPPPEVAYRPNPLHLDLHVLAPADVTIAGRGLSSEWKGDFHLGGTTASLAAKGKLELIEGEFNFSSRSFKLTDGSLTLSGLEHQMPYLNIAGLTETKGINITVRLKGPINDPQITLQSSPPLPLGSIMSYLLFGQDISEIGGFQALQIATSLASLAGTGPDVMENTRRSLGVDRLRVVTDPTIEGGETVALQVGKYVSKGVLVTFTQGTEESSTNISVEIELKDNFVFQIESDQHQEQGKFTLKWNLNY